MGDPIRLSDFEQLVLLAVVRLEDDAYGVTVRREIEERGGRPVSVTATYGALERMEQRGLVESWIGEATPTRGGRAKKHFRITPEGASALWDARAELHRMWEGLEAHPDLGFP
jgi:PadR family transcriptional regulator PadR